VKAWTDEECDELAVDHEFHRLPREQTARERFVEAMRFVVKAGRIDLGPTPYLGGYGPRLRQATEEFARIEWFGSPSRDDETVEEHIAMLLKEIFGE